jgi:acetyl esterase/lipase
MRRKWLLALLGVVAVIGAGIYTAFQVSPWPSVLFIRYTFQKNGVAANEAIAPLVPKDMTARRNLSYAANDPDALLDVFSPPGQHGPLPAVVWVHGGGFVAGSRSELSNYMQVLAARGFVTVAIDYTAAPTGRFPTPVRETNSALAYVVANAQRFNIDPRRIFLAGDSAGAQIAAQTALIVSDPAYARRLSIEPGMRRDALRGVVLYCGLYDPTSLNFDGAIRTRIWSYIGTKNPLDPRVRQMSVTPNVTAAYPPVFISVGNADPLAPQSVAFADALRAKGVVVDALFFPDDHKPPLDHEYQLALGSNEGHLALERSVAFLNAQAK